MNFASSEVLVQLVWGCIKPFEYYIEHAEKQSWAPSNGGVRQRTI